MSEAFWAKLYCKIRLSIKQSQIKKKLWWCPVERVEEYKKAVCPKKYFKKIVLNMRFWVIYILVQISLFGGLIFQSRPAMAVDNFTQPPPPHHKKASYDPVKWF